MSGASVAPPGPTSDDAPNRLFELVHGGLRFRIRVEDGVVPWLDDDDRPFVHPCDASAPLGEVSVRLHRGPDPRDREGPAETLRFRSGPGEFSLDLFDARVRIDAHDHEARCADVWCGRPELALGPALTATSAFVAQRRGGLVVHCTAVELGGTAVLFVGPSGAGKSTAASMCLSGRAMAWDRAVLAPSGSEWVVAGLSGGTPVAIPVSERSSAPAAAVLRVRRGTSRPGIVRADGAEAFFLLRESTVWVTDPDERTCGDRVEAVLDRLRAASVHTVLGQPLDDLLGGWLHGG